jgi:hypothetical protein
MVSHTDSPFSGHTTLYRPAFGGGVCFVDKARLGILSGLFSTGFLERKIVDLSSYVIRGWCPVGLSAFVDCHGGG